ncbi:MAG: SDR family oxidoreductase [Actinobacteria bacterium]|nr:SDR family oxidoreductase [Actinomycetota bacterium]
MGRLDDKVAIVTGSGQGIGLEYARRYLAEGAKVVIAEINEERGASAVSELGGGDAVTFVRTDISDEASAEACVAATVERFGRVDVLVNNAALYYDIDNRDQSLEYLRKVFDVNLHGTWIMIKSVAPTMVEQGGGAVINQSSGAAYTYVIPPMGSGRFKGVGSFSYSQTKHGVIGLTKFMAGQLGRHGIRVNCIVPGITRTEATEKQVPSHFLDALRFMTALQKDLEPEDLTGAAVFFASDDARMITGQILCVDAGMNMPG